MVDHNVEIVLEYDLEEITKKNEEIGTNIKIEEISSENFNNKNNQDNKFLIFKESNDIPNTQNNNINIQTNIPDFFTQDNFLFIPQSLRDYLPDIYSNLIEEEKAIKSKVTADYMTNHKDINPAMRAILIDWLVDVHLRYKLKDETLFLTVSLIDKYLGAQQMIRSRLQLLGVASLMIACKYEEIMYPHTNEFVGITDSAYTKTQLLSMELEILNTLEFNITSPSTLKFYEIIAQAFKFNKTEFMFGRYFLELALIDYKISRCNPSLVACACAYITMKFYGFSNYSNIYSNFFNSNSTIFELKDCAKEICNFVEKLKNSNLQAINKKFEKREFCGIFNIINSEN